jgi:PAS domain S-box-containing protein
VALKKEKDEGQFRKELAELRQQVAELERVRNDLLHTEEALRESEDRYRNLVENLNDVVFNLDPMGRFSYISPAIENITSYKIQEILGQSFEHFVHPDDIQGALSGFARILAGKPELLQFRALDKDGGVIYAQTSTRPLLKDGELVGMTGIITDITERKRTEEELKEQHDHLEELVQERTGALREAYLKLQYEMAERKRKEAKLIRSERYFRALIENAYDIIAVLDAEGVMRYLSPSLERITGFTNEERLGKNAFEFFHPDDLTESMEAFFRGIQQPGFTEIVEFRWQHKDDSWHTEEAVASNLLDDPDVRGIVVNARDITDRKQAEERLAKLNRCFLSLGPDPAENIEKIALAGRDILEGTMVQYVRRDKGDTSILSCSRENEGCSYVDRPQAHFCFHLMDARLGEPLVLANMEGDEFYQGTEEEKGGLRSCLALPVIVEREPRGYLCLFDAEVRDFRKEEIDILQMLVVAISNEEERWSYEEYLRDFIDIASHELRHPVALVIGFAETLESQEAEVDIQTRNEIIDAIKLGADRLDKLAAGLMSISLLERDRLKITRRKTDLRALIRQSVAEMNVIAPGRTFNVAVDKDVREYEIDPDKIHDLLTIVLENAVKYSPDDTDVEIEAKLVRGEIMVSVSDRGIGVPEEHRERIFNRFHQVEETRYHSKPGLGLGLYLARGIAQIHGGKIWHEPREGGGSVFRITLPI